MLLLTAHHPVQQSPPRQQQHAPSCLQAHRCMTLLRCLLCFKDASASNRHSMQRLPRLPSHCWHQDWHSSMLRYMRTAAATVWHADSKGCYTHLEAQGRPCHCCAASQLSQTHWRPQQLLRPQMAAWLVLGRKGWMGKLWHLRRGWLTQSLQHTMARTVVAPFLHGWLETSWVAPALP